MCCWLACFVSLLQHAVAVRSRALQIQYPGLDRQVRNDFWMLHSCAKAVGFLFPSLEFSWMVPDFEANMKRELDFLQVRSTGGVRCSVCPTRCRRRGRCE